MLAQLSEGAAVAYADDVTLLASGDTATWAATALQGLLDVVCRWLTINYLHLNPLKCTTMCVAAKKSKSAVVTHEVNINCSPISHVQSVKILCVTFNSELDWRQHASTLRAKTTKKLAVLRRVGGSLNKHVRAHVFKVCIKPHVEYFLPVWACCGSELSYLDRMLVRAKCIITNQKSASIAKLDFKTLGIALLHDFMMLSVCTQYFNYIHSGHNSIHLISQNNVA